MATKKKKPLNAGKKDDGTNLMDLMLGLNAVIEPIIASEDARLMKETFIPTEYPMMNIAMSGKHEGGGINTGGLSIFAGPSKHFKTIFCLMCIKAWMVKYPKGIILFYNNEWGVTKKYFTRMDIDMSRIVHLPFKTLENVTIDLTNRLDMCKHSSEVAIMIDSVGNSASKKERDDAMTGSDKEDMTRAKKLKSMFRLITPYLSELEIPMFVVNHIYMTHDLFAKKVMGGGSGPMLSADEVFFVEKQVIKEDTDLETQYQEQTGSKFTLYVDKSRQIPEGSRFPIVAKWGTGISKYFGLLELATHLGVLSKVSRGNKGSCVRFTEEHSNDENKDIEVRVKEYEDKEGNYFSPIEDNGDFWDIVFKTTNFNELIAEKYQG